MSGQWWNHTTLYATPHNLLSTSSPPLVPLSIDSREWKHDKPLIDIPCQTITTQRFFRGKQREKMTTNSRCCLKATGFVVFEDSHTVKIFEKNRK